MLKLHLLCWGVLNLLIYCIEFRNRWNEKKTQKTLYTPTPLCPTMKQSQTLKK